MNELFYGLSFIYILYDLTGLKKTFFPTKGEDDLNAQIKVPTDALDMGTAMDNLNTVRQFSIGKIFSIINNVFFWCWLIAGALYTEQHNIFLGIIIVNIINFIFPFIIIFYKVSKRVDEDFLPAFMRELKDVCSAKIIKWVVLADSLIKYCAVGYILYWHFYL